MYSISINFPNILALCILVALIAYALFGGADFGGGVWDLFASGSRKAAQRETIAHAIGPIWEANHVWLIIVVVLMFVCFPPAFATIMTVLHIPLSLMLIGIVARGSAFTFRAYDARGAATVPTTVLGRTFAIASVLTPLLLGVSLGTIAAGRVTLPTPGVSAYAIYVEPWLAPFPIACGVLAVVLFAYLAAVYLTVAAEDPAIQEDFRRRALWSAVAVFVAAFGTLALALTDAPSIKQGLTETPWAIVLHAATGVAAISAIVAVWRRRYRAARIAAAMQVALIIAGWGASQYPWMIPGSATIAVSAAPEATLRWTLSALAAGAVVLLPSLWYLFTLFDREVPSRN